MKHYVHKSSQVIHSKKYHQVHLESDWYASTAPPSKCFKWFSNEDNLRCQLKHWNLRNSQGIKFIQICPEVCTFRSQSPMLASSIQWTLHLAHRTQQMDANGALINEQSHDSQILGMGMYIGLPKGSQMRTLLPPVGWEMPGWSRMNKDGKRKPCGMKITEELLILYSIGNPPSSMDLWA